MFNFHTSTPVIPTCIYPHMYVDTKPALSPASLSLLDLREVCYQNFSLFGLRGWPPGQSSPK